MMRDRIEKAVDKITNLGELFSMYAVRQVLCAEFGGVVDRLVQVNQELDDLKQASELRATMAVDLCADKDKAERRAVELEQALEQEGRRYMALRLNAAREDAQQRRRVMDAEARVTELEGELKHWKAGVEQQADVATRLHDERNTARARVAELDYQRNYLADRIKLLSAKVTNAESRVTELEAEVVELRRRWMEAYDLAEALKVEVVGLRGEKFQAADVVDPVACVRCDAALVGAFAGFHVGPEGLNIGPICHTCFVDRHTFDPKGHVAGDTSSDGEEADVAFLGTVAGWIETGSWYPSPFRADAPPALRRLARRVKSLLAENGKLCVEVGAARGKAEADAGEMRGRIKSLGAELADSERRRHDVGDAAAKLGASNGRLRNQMRTARMQLSLEGEG